MNVCAFRAFPVTRFGNGNGQTPQQPPAAGATPPSKEATQGNQPSTPPEGQPNGG